MSNKWVLKKCSKIRGKLQSNIGFQCGVYLGDVEARRSGKKRENFILEKGVELEYVSKFCYLGDMISASGGSELASSTRTRCAWTKFRELSPKFLPSRGVSLKVKGKTYKAFVHYCNDIR